MKKFIALAVLAGGVLAWRMGAMDQGDNNKQKMDEVVGALSNMSTAESPSVTLQTSDKENKSISIGQARLLGVVNDLLVDVSEDGVVPLSNIESSVLDRVLNDLNELVIAEVYGISDLTNQEALKDISKRSWQERKELVRVEFSTNASELPVVQYSKGNLEAKIEDLKAANYLQIPELVEGYAKQIADLLASDDVLRLQARGDASLLNLLSNASISPDFKHQIYAYMPQDFWYEQAVIEFKSEINSAQFSPAGTRVVTASHDGQARIYWWNDTEWINQAVINAGASVLKAEFLSGGNKVMFFCKKHAGLSEWHENQWAIKIRYALPYDIALVAFSADHSQVLIADNNNRSHIFFWDGARLVEQNNTQLPSRIDSAVFSPDSSMLAISLPKALFIFRKEGDRWVAQSYILHAGMNVSVIFRPDGTLITSSSEDRPRIFKWDGIAWTQTTSIGYESSIKSIATSPDGKMLTALSDDGDLHLYVQSGLVYAQSAGVAPYNKYVFAVNFSPDGRKLVIVSLTQGVQIFSRTFLGRWELEGEIANKSDLCKSVVFSPDGKRIMQVGSNVLLGALVHAISFDQAFCLQLLEWAHKNNSPERINEANEIIDAAWNSFSSADKAMLQKKYNNKLPEDKRKAQ